MQLWASYHLFQSQLPPQYPISEGYENQMIYVKHVKAHRKLHGQASIGKSSQMKKIIK